MKIYLGVLMAAACGATYAQVQVNCGGKQVNHSCLPAHANENVESDRKIDISHSLLRRGEYLQEHQDLPAHRVLKPAGLFDGGSQPKPKKSGNSDNKQEPAKVLMCHIPRGNPSSCHNISINESSVAKHLKKGGLVGDCVSACQSFCSDKSASSCPFDEPNKCTCCECSSQPKRKKGAKSDNNQQSTAAKSGKNQESKAAKPGKNQESKAGKSDKEQQKVKLLMCYIPPGDPSSCHNISVKESAVAKHLEQGDLLGDCVSSCKSFCSDTAATTCPLDEQNKCTCCGCEKRISCFEGERVECEKGMVSVCHFHEDNTYATLCIVESDVPGHLALNENDYFGKCAEDIFIEKSVMMDLPPAHGIEDHGSYEIDYNVTYNEDGIIVLAKSVDIIDGVICAPGSVEILFSVPLTSQVLASMFPERAILVVDGRRFDTECNVHPSREIYKGEHNMNVGFLVIHASHVDGLIVTVTGSATIFDAIFEEQLMQYRMHPSSGNGTRELVSLKDIEGKLTVPPDGHLQLVSSVAFSGYATLGDFKFTTRMVRVGTWLPVYLPEFEYAGEMSYQITAKFINTLKIKSSDLQLLDEEFEPIGPFGIPGVSLDFPPQITKLLDLQGLEPRVGLVIALPITISAKLVASYDIDLKSSATIDLGKTRVKVGLSYQPLRLIPLLPVYEKLESEEPLLIHEDQPEQDDKLPLSGSSLLSFEGQIGLEPQIRLDMINLAWIGIGTFIGFELFAALRSDPYPPTEGLNSACSSCHFIESNGGLIVKDLFMKYKPFVLGGTKPQTEKLIEFYLKWVWFKFCLSTSIERSLTCGNSCCAPTDNCEYSTVPPVCESADCRTECCSDNQCPVQMICNTDGQCECPHECCSDSDCMSGKDICDMSSNKCTNKDGVVDIEPFRVVHIGDSYSAGTGAGEYTHPQGCYRSTRNWGQLYRNSLPAHIAATYVNRACNGAVMENYFNKALLEITESPCRSPIQDEVFEDDGVTCKRFVEAQYKAITSDVDLVLMTFGGNDLNFGSIVRQCFVIGIRDVEACKEEVTAAESYVESGEFKKKLVEVLRDLGQQLKKPNAKVVLSAYPHLLMDKDYILGVLDTYDAGAAIRNLAVFVDEIQQIAVDEANSLEGREFVFYFDKTKAVFAAHEPDPSVLVKNPYRWMNEFFEPGTDLKEWYHPNIRGHEEWANALSRYGTFDSVNWRQENSGANNIDLAFVIDTTSSMQPYIASAKAEMKSIVNQISTSFQSYRVSIVSYQDINPGDYPSRVDLDFTDDYDKIQAGIDLLETDGGGDLEETVLSGLNAALDLTWRAGVSKATILIGDAPAKVDAEGKEPGSGLTATQIIAKSEAIDPVQIMAVNLKDLLSKESTIIDIVNGTGGIIESGAGGVVAAIYRILDKVSKQPFAWFGESIIARVDYPVLFDAGGSFDPLGGKISSYEWDFDGDGIYDEMTNMPTAVHAYNAPFEGYVLLRVTSDGGAGFASAGVIVNAEGSVSQVRDEYCDWDATSGLPILQDKDGNPLNCMINGTMWPMTDKPGIAEDYRAAIKACLEVLGSPVLDFQPCDVQVKMRIIRKETETGDYYEACRIVRDMMIDLDECVTMCQVLL